MIYFSLFFEFFKIGLFAIGGGMATIPFLRHLSETSGWYSIAFITDMVAISESTPGPIGINMATYAGYHIAGMLGGIIATMGMVLPSIIIVTIVSGYMEKFSHSETLQQAFYGLRPAVTGLIAVACFDIIRLAVFNLEAWTNFSRILEVIDVTKLAYFGIIYFLIIRFKRHPINYIAISAIVGIILGMGH
ncbi:MAG TPA: chromate transporter [Clostridiales bacterium UBA8960]|jgi:chromate transporter|nr:chromate transporter [Clostridiales bacterium UBA8960]